MLHRSSITFRLAIGIGLSQLLLTAGLVLIGTLRTYRQLLAAFDTSLHGRAMGLVALVHYPEKGTGLLFERSLVPPPMFRRHPDLYLLRRLDGTVIAGFVPHTLTPPLGDSDTYWNFKVNGVPYRGLSIPDTPILDTEEDVPGSPAHIRVVCASPLRRVYDGVWETAISIATASLILLLAADIFAFWMIRRSLDPLRDLAEQAAAIGPGQWSFQPSPHAQQTRELAPLVSALQTMLARLRDSFQRQSEFLADAAHELKTPVTILKTSLQRLEQRPRSAEEYRAGLTASLADIERMERLLHRMLKLARLERWAGYSLQNLPLTELGLTCDAAVARILPLAQARQIAIRTIVETEIPEQHVRGEADELELVWVNLLENAVQYSPAGGEVRIRRWSQDGMHLVSVEDQGPGIPPGEIPLIFERFHRGDPSRTRATGGFGLGLAIARAIVLAASGDIVVTAAESGGARFVVRLPVQSANE